MSIELDEFSCKKLWLAVVEAHYSCAINNFNTKDTFENTLERLKMMIDRNPDHFRAVFNPVSLKCVQSRYFFETSQFDEIVFMCGYDTLFINKLFAKIQKAITYENELTELFREKTEKRYARL